MAQQAMSHSTTNGGLPVANLAAACRSQLINIPTGLGKTAAVVLAWLWNRVQLQNPNGRAGSFIACRCGHWWSRQRTTSVNGSTNLNLADAVGVHVLMGGEDARDWDIHPERPAILIGTQDMLLSRALNRGYGMSRYAGPCTSDCSTTIAFGCSMRCS